MLLSGNTLPQVSAGGFISGTLHIVTSDGAGPYKALLDTSGTGNFTHAVEMDVVTQVPGDNGNISKAKPRAWERALETFGIYKRATNINEDFVSHGNCFSLLLTYKPCSRLSLPCQMAQIVLARLLVNLMSAWSRLSIHPTQE